MLPIVVAPTDLVFTGNAADVEPPGMLMLVGTVAAGLALDRFTITPAPGAALDKLTVPLAD